MQSEINRKIAIRIIEARREKGWTQNELSARSGVHRTTIIRYEDPKNEKVKLDVLQKIADALGKTVPDYFMKEYNQVSDLETYKDANKLDSSWNTKSGQISQVPLISWVKANRFEEANDAFPPGVADEYIYSTTKGENMFALKVSEDCMEPEFREGDIIIVKPNISVSNGDFVIIKDTKANEATFKQYKVYGKKVILHPLNPKYQDIELDHDERYEIIGKVVEKVKKY